MLKEFKEFAFKGNVLDLAIGIIIGAAFSAIINSIVKDLIMPFFSLFTNNVNFTDMFISLDGTDYKTLEAAQKASAATFNYGSFIQQLINFLIIALVIFLFVKQINKYKKPAAVTTKDCPHCLTKINIKATKCPSCTADIAVVADAEILV